MAKTLLCQFLRIKFLGSSLLVWIFLFEAHVSHIPCAKSVLAMVAKAGAVQLGSTKRKWGWMCHRLVGVWFKRPKTCRNSEKLRKAIAYIEVCRVLMWVEKRKDSYCEKKRLLL